jgi:hypothetical protein
LSRREFLASYLVVSAVAFLPPGPPSCGSGHRRGLGPGDHPRPRPGISAARVLRASELRDAPKAVAAFDDVRMIPQVIDGIRCHCGCAKVEGYYSLLSCFENADAMAKICDVCQGQARYAFRLHKVGKSLDEIRAAIDARYG